MMAGRGEPDARQTAIRSGCRCSGCRPDALPMLGLRPLVGRTFTARRRSPGRPGRRPHQRIAVGSVRSGATGLGRRPDAAARRSSQRHRRRDAGRRGLRRAAGAVGRGLLARLRRSRHEDAGGRLGAAAGRRAADAAVDASDLRARPAGAWRDRRGGAGRDGRRSPPISRRPIRRTRRAACTSSRSRPSCSGPSVRRCSFCSAAVGAGAARGLRQRRQPAARACDRPRAGSRGAVRARRHAGTHRPPGARRNAAADADRSRRRRRPRLCSACARSWRSRRPTCRGSRSRTINMPGPGDHARRGGAGRRRVRARFRRSRRAGSTCSRRSAGSSARNVRGPARARLRSALVVAELAFAVVLVCGAALLIRSFLDSAAREPGIPGAGCSEGGVSAAGRVAIPSTSAAGRTSRNSMRSTRRCVRRAAALPGVTSAAIAGNHPLDPGFTNSFTVVGREAEARTWPEISIRRVSPSYFPNRRAAAGTRPPVPRQRQHRGSTGRASSTPRRRSGSSRIAKPIGARCVSGARRDRSSASSRTNSFTA